ncbi:MAG TPA: glycoside hydrolase family 3 N-terminal domain-containing protein [Solirubrobacterales bacterium]|nr:glycoside hydrolase family 3 N-terminal domain-containing protein [Solirubrobacterales bacterium]
MGTGLARRRRIAVGAVAGLAIAAFACGAVLSERGSQPPPPSIASQLSLRRLVGERLVGGFSGTEPPAPLRRMIGRGELAGVIFFEANLADRAAARQLSAEIQSIPRPRGLRDPLLLMVDQEGGLVKRLGGAPTLSAAQMGEAGARVSREQGRETAIGLRRAGLDVDLAPVLDIARPGGTIGATERSFGATAAQVAATAVPFAEGLREGRVIATAKHFPGLGAAAENTDLAVQRIDLSRRELRAVDERPYRPFIAAGGEMVMLSTAIYPAFSPRPAAFARPIATGELRRRLSFEGVSITDALESAAVGDFGGPAAAALAAAAAGTDLLLFTDYRAAATAGAALVRELRRDPRDRSAFETSASRVLRLRHALAASLRPDRRR